MMRHASLFGRALRQCDHVRRICDLGAGDGWFMLRVAEELRWRDVELVLMDRQPVIENQTKQRFDQLGWRVSVVADDVFSAVHSLEPCDAITANLFLHHFHDDALRELLGLVAERTRLFIACEPSRSSAALFAGRNVALIGCNSVTRHDAVASVRAGFRGQELSALWPAMDRWQITERAAGLFSHLFIARNA
jgi:hypothetical protein